MSKPLNYQANLFVFRLCNMEDNNDNRHKAAPHSGKTRGRDHGYTIICENARV